MLHRLSDLGAAVSAAASIGATHIIVAIQTNMIPDDPGEFLRWAIKESALLVVVLIVLWFYRRDFKNKSKTDTALIRESVTVNTQLQGTVARLARAIEEMNRRHRSGDPPAFAFRDPEDPDPGRRTG